MKFEIQGPDRQDVKQAAVLSYATLVYHAFAEGKLDRNVFEKYVNKYFESFMSMFKIFLFNSIQYFTNFFFLRLFV